MKITKKVAPIFIIGEFFSIFCFVLILKPEAYEPNIITPDTFSSDIIKIRISDKQVLTENKEWDNVTKKQITSLQDNSIAVNNQDGYKTYIVDDLKDKLTKTYFDECMPSDNQCDGKDIVITDNLDIIFEKR